MVEDYKAENVMNVYNDLTNEKVMSKNAKNGYSMTEIKIGFRQCLR